MPNSAKASCGYYVVIGRPSAQADEQARMRQEMPLEHQKTPCEGGQCRRNDRPINHPAQSLTVLSHDAMTLSVRNDDSIEISHLVDLDHFSFSSDPHIWRIDPPPRA